MAESLYRPLRPVGTGPGQLSVEDRMDRSLLAKFKKPGGQDNEQKPVRDGDLIGSMAKRLSCIEAELASSRAQVQQLLAENARLLAQQQLSSSLSSSPPQSTTPPPPASSSPAAAARPSALPVWQVQAGQLQQENARLRSQCRRAWRMVEQLKAFLQDYGLVWVGDPEQEGTQHALQQQGEGQQQGGTPARMLEELQPGAASEAWGTAPQQTASSSATAASPAAAASSVRPPQPGAAAPARLPLDLQQLKTSLQELNALAGEGSSRLVQLHSPGSPGSSRAQPGASGPYTLQEAPTVRLWLFSDGLQLHHCPPQPYSSSASQGIISDISDGYYPTALRQHFPEGVIIQLEDCTSQPMAAAAAAAVAAAGHGAALLHAAGSSSGGGGGRPGPLSQQQFLQKLPATVIKAGRIINVTGDVAGFMAGQQPHSNCEEGSGPRSASASPTRLVVPPADGAAAAGALPSPVASPSGLGPDLDAAAGHAEPVSPAAPGEASVTLQVKDEQGQHTYILAMKAGHTIGELRRRIDAYRASQKGGAAAAGGGRSSSSGSYEIRSAFPARLYDDDGATLQQAGLVPTATLLLRGAGGKQVGSPVVGAV